MEARIAPELAEEAGPFIEAARGRRNLVWGAGLHGQWLMERLGASGIGFIDSNPLKQGTTIIGRPVHAPAELAALAYDRILIAVLSDHGSLAWQLREKGLAEGRDFDVVFPSGKLLTFRDWLPRYVDFLRDFDLRDKTALEVGSGGQFFLGLLFAFLGAERVIVTDITRYEPDHFARSRALLARCAKLLAERHPGLAADPGADADALVARLEPVPEPVAASELPFREGAVDVVYSTGVMEHVSDPEAAIGDFARVLKPAGLAFSFAVGIHDHRANVPESGFSKWSFLAVPEREWATHRANPYHQNRWRCIDFRRAFARHGFVPEKDWSTVDPGLSAEEIVRFQPEFRRYTRHELSEMDLWLAARKHA